MPRKFCWISTEAIDSALYLSNSGWLEKLIRLLLSLGLLFLLCKRKTLLLTIICVNLYHRVQVLCFSECGRIPWSQSQEFVLVLVLETKTKTWFSLAASGWGFFFFFIICPLGKFKSLTPSSCCRKELFDSLPSSPPLQRWRVKFWGGWGRKTKEDFGPEEEAMRLKAWSQ